ncbi:hypothetical protein [Priestia megaterium]|uniref:hypothetical protein n=1 Tax=Priestia megaterium TaxID=1404 RepID=UPI0012D9158F|nr:hypothetical protein [Priestia megaterium]MUL33969.1 hypothetical protein [Priestia megaterium]
MDELSVGAQTAENVRNVGNYRVFRTKHFGYDDCYYVIDKRDENCLLLPNTDDYTSIIATLEKKVKEAAAAEKQNEEEALISRLQSHYKVIYENWDESDLRDLMFITLTKISLLINRIYGEKYDMFHFEQAIEIVNRKYNTKYTVDDFYLEL